MFMLIGFWQTLLSKTTYNTIPKHNIIVKKRKMAEIILMKMDRIHLAIFL